MFMLVRKTIDIIAQAPSQFPKSSSPSRTRSAVFNGLTVDCLSPPVDCSTLWTGISRLTVTTSQLINSLDMHQSTSLHYQSTALRQQHTISLLLCTISQLLCMRPLPIRLH